MIGMVDPTNVFAIDDIKFMTGFKIEPVVASESSILAGIDKSYGGKQEEDLETVMQAMSEMNDSDIEGQAEEQQMELSQLEKAPAEPPVVKLLNFVLPDPLKHRPTDTPIQPYPKQF